MANRTMHSKFRTSDRGFRMRPCPRTGAASCAARGRHRALANPCHLMGDRETREPIANRSRVPTCAAGQTCIPSCPRLDSSLGHVLSIAGAHSRSRPSSNAIFLPNSVAGPFLFAKERMDEPVQLAGHGRARPELRASSVSPNAAYKITNKSWGRLIKDCSEECRREALRTLAH